MEQPDTIFVVASVKGSGTTLRDFRYRTVIVKRIPVFITTRQIVPL